MVAVRLIESPKKAGKLHVDGSIAKYTLKITLPKKMR